MKYYTFHRESNDFTDILSDMVLKKYIKEKIKWTRYFIVGFDEVQHDKKNLESYILLKYGDSIQKELVKDYSPIMNKDYTPKKEKQ